MTRFIFLLILFSVGYILYHLYGKKLIQKGPRALIGPLLALALIIILFAVATGRANAIFAVIGGLLAAAWRAAPMLVRFYPQIRQLLNQFGGKPTSSAQQSKVETPVVTMFLDHSTGEMDGMIKTGEFQNRNLSSLDLQEIGRFYRFCQQQDSETLRLVQAYLQRQRPEIFDEQSSKSQEDSPATISRREALDILGLPDQPSRDQIVDAHRKLISKLHPDKGGSHYLATRVNQAKDLLLADLGTER